MRLLIIFFFFPFQAIFSYSLQYGLDAKCDGVVPIKALQIFSERCSGSNYLEEILHTNFSFEERKGFGFKHFPPWFSHSIDQIVGHPRLYTFEGNEETIFVVIFRNPYDWLRSLRNSPHHAIDELHEIPFKDFIRKPWRTNPDIRKRHGSLTDLDPSTNGPFENVMRLRSAKIQNMLEIKNRVSNIYFLNYEILSKYPKEVMEEISELFDLIPKQQDITNVRYYKKNKKRVYTKKKYPKIRKKDLLYINRYLDVELEESIGYPLTIHPSDID